jgi:hypothetical protein
MPVLFPEELLIGAARRAATIGGVVSRLVVVAGRPGGDR